MSKPNTAKKRADGTTEAVKPKRGKGSAVLIRVTQDTRNALERESQRTGRSLSQTAEIWIDKAIEGRATYLERLGGDTAWAAAIEKLVEIARAVNAQVHDKNLAAWALRAAWQHAVLAALPLPALPEDWQKQRAEAQAVWDACRRIFDILDTKDTADPVYRRAIEPLMGSGGLLGDRVIADRLAYVLIPPNAFDAGTNGLDQRVCAALRELGAAGDTAAKEIGTALHLAVAYVDRHEREGGEIRRAMVLGRDIAAKLTETGK